MIKITLIVGLPGSGKTTYAKSLLGDGVFLVDDPSKDKSLFDQAVQSSASHVIVSDPLLINSNKERAEKFLKDKFGEIETHWIYFENDMSAAWANHIERNKVEDRKISHSFFQMLSENYIIPEGAVILPVYKRDNNG